MSLNRLGASARVCASARRSNRLLTRVGHLLRLPLASKAAKPLSLCAALLSATIAASAAAETTTATEYANNSCTGTDGATPCTNSRIEIATLAQLRRLSERSQDWSSAVTVVLTADINAADTSTWNVGDHDNDGLTADVPMGFRPVGTGSSFAGTFDGDGHVISGLYINRPTSNEVGLISTGAGATVQSLGLSDINYQGAGNVGGLVGKGGGLQVISCYTTGSVTGAGGQVGGLVGFADGGLIQSSYSTASVEGASSLVGGIVGFVYNGNVTTSYSAAVVTSSGEKGVFVGRLSQGGNGSASVTSSYWTNDLQDPAINGLGSTNVPAETNTLDGLNTVQMRQKINFGNFAFVADPPGDPITDTPWVIVDGTTTPFLWWQDDDGDGIAAYLDPDPFDQAPTAVDVYAATLVSTASTPQSATVVLEGADPEADALTYTVVSAPSNGTLSDPNNGNSVVTTGAIAGQTLTYTPADGFTSTDTFTYKVNDGVSDSTTTYTATITVFDGGTEPGQTNRGRYRRRDAG